MDIIGKILKVCNPAVDLKINSNQNVAIMITLNVPPYYKADVLSMAEINNVIERLFSLISINFDNLVSQIPFKEEYDHQYYGLDNSIDIPEDNQEYSATNNEDNVTVVNIKTNDVQCTEDTLNTEDNLIQVNITNNVPVDTFDENTTVINIKKEKKVRSVICPICHHRMSPREYNKKHIKICTTSNPYVHIPIPCDQCGTTFNDKDGVRNHKRRMHSQQEQICDKCDFKCSNKESLQKHIKRQHSKDRKLFTCEICGKTTFLSNKRNHMRYMHEEKVMVKCELCGKDINKHGMAAHIRIKHEKNHQCPHCTHKSGSISNLKLHMSKVHFGQDREKFECPHCFEQTLDLAKHIRVKHKEIFLQNVE